MNEPLAKVIAIIGGQKALADALSKKPGVSVKQGHVWSWLNVTQDGTPSEHVINACEVVGFEVTPHELRPDIYPYQHDGLPEHLRQVA
jgi:DNA-binding transcriptional regulator YdaS (Cro superfamily)